MLSCPYCGQTAMNYWQKSILGPARTMHCRACGKPISVHVASMAALIPLLLVIVSVRSLDSVPLILTLLIASAAAMFAIHQLLVPLVRRGG